jgi:hypothetical protein
MERPGIPAADASALALRIYGLLNDVRYLEAQFPHISDYRLNDAREGLTAAFKGVDHLARGANYNEWNTVRAAYPSLFDPLLPPPTDQ